MKAVNIARDDIVTQNAAPADLVTALLDALPVPVFYKDADLRYIGVNRAYLSFTGQRLEDLIGKAPADMWDTDAAAVYEAADRQLLDQGGVQVYETTMVRADGEVREVIIHKAIFDTGDGRPDGIVGQIMDVTERKRAEMAAHQAAEAKNQFLANMSHELRTPLNGVLGMTSLLGQTVLTSDQDGYVKTIGDSGRALLAIIDDVLDFSRIDDGRLVLKASTFSLRAMTAARLEQVAATAEAKGIAVGSVIDDRVAPRHVGDVTRIGQIVDNLLTNAIRFTREGEVEVAVGVVDDAEGRGGPIAGLPHQRLRVSVRDTGVGIPADHFDRIFESFSQADNSATRRFGGTGLGLAISRRLAELMGGSLTVSSRLGEGSCFVAEIPLRLAPAEPAGPTDADPRAGAGNDPSVAVEAGGPASTTADQPALRILMAEDNVVNQKVATGLLRRLGHQVTVVGDGRQAVEAVDDQDYDVILMDIHMPEMGGLEATERIRQNRDGRGRPWIIAVTADVFRGARESYLAQGVDDYVAKPLTLEAVGTALMRASTR